MLGRAKDSLGGAWCTPSRHGTESPSIRKRSRAGPQRSSGRCPPHLLLNTQTERTPHGHGQRIFPLTYARMTTHLPPFPRKGEAGLRVREEDLDLGSRGIASAAARDRGLQRDFGSAPSRSRGPWSLGAGVPVSSPDRRARSPRAFEGRLSLGLDSGVLL